MLTNKQKEYINNLPKEIAEKPVEIFHWEDKSLDIAQSVINSIKSADPQLEVFLGGSTSLKISGQKDIDLTCNDPTSTFYVHKEKLEPVLGKANKQNDSSVVWHFLKDGYEISFYIVDPKKSDQLERQTKMNNLLKNNPQLLREYEDLKISLSGVPYGVYQEKKYEFFNRILKHAYSYIINMPMSSSETAIFGGGCFWCTEAVFKMLRGVKSVAPGYAGGTTANPTYDEVSTGKTGHAEVIKIEFDPAQISFENLLAVFASHDPTTRNRQGHDVGPQYRSVILYTTPAQKSTAEKFIEAVNQSSKEGKNITTEIKRLDIFYPAEAYHADYYARNKQAPYCELVINPKLEKIQEKYAELLKSGLKSS